MRVFIVALLLAATALAGCAGSGDEPAADADEPACEGGFCGQETVDAGDGRDLRTDLTVEDAVPAPAWEVGDVFEQHMFFGKDDLEGTHIQTMVVETDGSGSVLATSDEEAARFEATYDYPILGRIGAQLETTAFGSDWSWMYRFPLQDGATWTGSVEGLINWNTYNFSGFDITLQATYDEAIDTPHGDFPGLWIEGTTEDGELLARYNYVPAIGWFSHFWLYDWDTQEPEDFMFHAMSMGTSKNYTGPFYQAEAEAVMDDFFGVFPNPGNPAGSVQGQPGPRDFTVPESDRVMGIAVPIAFPGRTEIVVTEPDEDQTTYAYQQLGADGPGFDVYFIDQETEVGGWQAEFRNAAVFTGAYLWLSAVTVEEGSLP